jgi:phosphatidylglycerol:prolipoprotein diacylglycerol transferase
MYPELFRIPTPWGAVPVFSYGTMIALGFLLTYLYVCRLAIRRGIDDEDITDIYLVIIVTSIIGARLNYVVSNWREYAAHPATIIRIWEGGMVYLGGFIGAMVGGLGYLWLRGRRFGIYYDMYAPAVPFACALGRVGCFLNGCCFGVECSLPWAMTFPKRTGGGVEPRHPTQIYEMIMLFAIAFAMHVYYKRNRRPGMAMVMFAYLYSLDRFIIEFFRAESTYESYIFGLTLAQSTCLLMVGVTGLCHLWIVKKTPPGPTPLEVEAELQKSKKLEPAKA